MIESHRKTIRTWSFISFQLFDNSKNFLLFKPPFKLVLLQPLSLIKLQSFHKRPPLLCLLIQVFIKLNYLVRHLWFVLINNPIHLQHTNMIIPSPRISHLMEEFGIVVSFLNAKHPRFLSPRNFYQRKKVWYLRSHHNPLTYLHFRKVILPFLSKIGRAHV